MQTMPIRPGAPDRRGPASPELIPTATMPPPQIGFPIPGWISREAAQGTNPMALATRIYQLASQFLEWLRLSVEDRSDTYVLQALSAALFNRYRAVSQTAGSRQEFFALELLQLNWPAGSELVKARIASLNELLRPSFSVYKAVRSPLAPEAFPTAEELQLAERVLLNSHADLQLLVTQLGTALRCYAIAASPEHGSIEYK